MAFAVSPRLAISASRNRSIHSRDSSNRKFWIDGVEFVLVMLDDPLRVLIPISVSL